ncbi:MAG: YraN family protein [Planctomycetes bacterium]|nr:YraN family protein [Planctomycetota bacterium]NOG55976.1 YraN family protein [Planctomycetota bacterium]
MRWLPIPSPGRVLERFRFPRFRSSAHRNARHRLGRQGERLAERYLKSQKYTTLARNHRTRFGEIDLIMRAPDGAIAFIEVKTRASGNAIHALGVNQQRRLLQQAVMTVRRHGWTDQRYRIDLVAVTPGTQRGERPVIRHIPNAVSLGR